ncbi:MAG: 16S rRNA (adenine(1518)-N(6)/adenine(1519)-N(6))-dimethyltransferase RsmA [Promethearchaeota archaeon]
MNAKEVKLVLNQLGVKPRKNKGQNFLVDENIAKKIVNSADISKEDVILEIGPGLGALTEHLIHVAKKVILVEIEPQFCSYLSNKFESYQNFEIINNDILNIDLPYHDKVVSNIPYTITGSLLEKIFFKNDPPSGTLVIEKSIEERINDAQKYKKISRIGICVRSFMNPTYMNDISPRSFYPIPNIALSLLKLEKKGSIDPFLLDKENIEFFLRFIAGIMPYKNKNIVNAIVLCLKNHHDKHIPKSDIFTILKKNRLKNIKSFNYGVSELLDLSKLVYKSFYKSQHNIPMKS